MRRCSTKVFRRLVVKLSRVYLVRGVLNLKVHWENKRRAVHKFRIEIKLPSVLLNDLFWNYQTHSYFVTVAQFQILFVWIDSYAAEKLEQLLLVLLLHSSSLIGDAYYQQTCWIVVTDFDQHVSFVCILNCILDNINDDLLKSIRITYDMHWQFVVIFNIIELLQKRVRIYRLVQVLQLFLELLVLYLLGKREVWIKIDLLITGLVDDMDPLILCFEAHHVYHFVHFLLQVETNTFLFEFVHFEALPIHHVFERVDDLLWMVFHDLQLATESWLWIMSFDETEFIAVLKLRTTLDHGAEGQTDSLLASLDDHALQIVLCLALLVQNAKSHILNVCDFVRLVVVNNLLLNYVD